MDSTGRGACLQHRAMEIAELELSRDVGRALIEKVIRFVVAEEGMLASSDALDAAADAVRSAEAERESAGLRAVPTIREVEEAAEALDAWKRLDEKGGERA